MQMCGTTPSNSPKTNHTTIMSIISFLYSAHLNYRLSMEVLFSTILASVIFLSFLVVWMIKNRNGRKTTAAATRQTAPEAPGSWPVIGHLHLLAGPELPHKTLGSMADKFGPIFTIKLGLLQALVVSDSELAKECFTTNDVALANRPKSIAVELMGYNYAFFGLTQYGPYWRQIRKIATVELLSTRRLELLRYIRESEVKSSIKKIYEVDCVKNESSGGVLIEMKKWFEDLTLNIIVRMVAGKRFLGNEEGEEGVVRFQKAIRDFMKLLGVFVVADAVPFLRFLDLGGHEKAMKRTAKDIDGILQSWVDEHKQSRGDSGDLQVKGEHDFIDVMLSILEDVDATETQAAYDADTINKATCLALLSGGTDTTTVTLTWALSLLLNHPHTLKKAQEEINIHVGTERLVQESDIKNLDYLQAIIKETFRLYPAGSLIPPHESMEDCVVGGYRIPKGTRIVVNAWKIHRDPKIWSDPEEFKPERFLTTYKEVDVRGQHFEFIPFGSGRRMCPGITLAHQVTHLTLASLLQGFEVATVGNKPVDMSESIGLSNLKATPLEVVVTPRLSSSLFE